MSYLQCNIMRQFCQMKLYLLNFRLVTQRAQHGRVSVARHLYTRSAACSSHLNRSCSEEKKTSQFGIDGEMEADSICFRGEVIFSLS